MKTACLLIGALSYAHGASINMIDVNADTSVTGSVDDFTWRYETQTVANSYDPDMWDMASTNVCGTGTSQSPINLEQLKAKAAATDPGRIQGNLWDADLEGYLANTGRVLRYMIFGMARPTITGGPLMNKMYALSHIDFHWGSINTNGSEHTIEGMSYPLEMQLVFYDSTFNNVNEVKMSSNADALVAISQMFKISTADNANLKNITDEIMNIEYTFTGAGRRKRESERQGRQMNGMVGPITISKTNNNLVDMVKINLMKLLGNDGVDTYYYYDGSMTVPDCKENTKWILADPASLVEISEAQLKELRKLKTNDVDMDYLQDNARPVQPLGTRTVYKRIKPFSLNEDAVKTAASAVVGAGVFNLVYNALNTPDVAKSIRENPLTDFIRDFELPEFPDLFEQEVVAARSSPAQEAVAEQQYYQQPVYQPQQYAQYQQYVPQVVPEAAPVQQ